MKKLLLFISVFMITAQSFAWSGVFRTSCGVILTINQPGANTVSEVVSYLRYINGMTCGVDRVSITFH